MFEVEGPITLRMNPILNYMIGESEDLIYWANIAQTKTHGSFLTKTVVGYVKMLTLIPIYDRLMFKPATASN